MKQKTVSKKVPIILALVWLAIAMGTMWYAMPKMVRMESWVADLDLQILVFLAGLVFSVVMMAVIRVLSKRAQVKWLTIVSKILLIFYSVIGGLAVLAFGIVLLIYR